MVIRNAPVLDDGTPMPTRFWLVGKRARLAIDRLEAAGRKGLPQVVAPGCIDYIVQGTRESLPAKYEGRATYYMNPLMTLVRTAANEMAEVGHLTAKRLNQSKGR